MKKRGMIPENHRAASEEKWVEHIKDLDSTTSLRWIYDQANGVCGYCKDAKGDRFGIFLTNKEMCKRCSISKKVCRYHRSFFFRFTLFAKFMKALKKENRPLARKHAVKIRDYVENDKPKEQS